MRRDYVPEDEGNLNNWAINLNTQAGLSANRTAMHWDTPTGDGVELSALNISSAIATKETARQVYLGVVAAQDAIIDTSLGVIRPAVADGRDDAPESVLQTMGFLGPEISFNPETFVPPFYDCEVAGPATVRVKFGKGRRVIAAVRVQMRRNGGAWIDLGLAMNSPWLDHTPLAQPGVPEIREYRIRGVLKDVEIGLYSDVKQVTVS